MPYQGAAERVHHRRQYLLRVNKAGWLQQRASPSGLSSCMRQEVQIQNEKLNNERTHIRVGVKAHDMALGADASLCRVRPHLLHKETASKTEAIAQRIHERRKQKGHKLQWKGCWECLRGDIAEHQLPRPEGTWVRKHTGGPGRGTAWKQRKQWRP